jgi:hypothetical protein
MARIRRILLQAALCFVAVLTVLSVVGAFLGATQAGRMFASAPMLAYWAALGVLLAAGLAVHRRAPGLAGMHLGALVILLGAAWGSQRGHALAARISGSPKVRSGYMVIREGETTDVVADLEAVRPPVSLPFSLRLLEFRIERYGPERPHSARTAPDGSLRPTPHAVAPQEPVKQYISRLGIVEDGAQVAEVLVKVNHPLHYGGYHFYQHTFGEQGGRYTVLSVVSDSGLAAVYCGFVLLCGGTFWQFWGRPVVAFIRTRGGHGA